MSTAVRPQILPLPSDVSQNLRSYSGGASTYINFVNRLKVDARVLWIDLSAKRIFYDTVKPGQTHRQQTYVGHPWEVVADNGFKADYLPTVTESDVILDGHPVLRPLPPSVADNLISFNGGSSTYVNFINRLTAPIKVYWVDHEGKRIHYADVKPGESYRQQTYVGHPWEVVTADGVKSNYLPTVAESDVILESNIPTLAPAAQSSFQALKSIGGQPATIVNFINRLNVEAKAYWIDYEGKRVLYATLKPGETRRQETYVGHPWEVVAENFKNVYLPIVTESNVILERDYSLKPGKIYTITNVKGGTAVDLSGSDQVSIIGYQSHGGPNQQWILESINGRWALKNRGYNKYLGVGRAGLVSMTPLNGVANPIQWDIRPEGAGGIFRLFTPGSALVMDLAGGAPDNMTPVLLYQPHSGTNQNWKFTEVST